MKINKLAQRLQKDRPMTMVSIRIPDDVIDDLKRVAPMLGFSGYQALIKAYIGQGLRSDLERLEGGVELSALLESLRKKGVDDEIISSAMAEIHSSAHAARVHQSILQHIATFGPAVKPVSSPARRNPGACRYPQAITICMPLEHCPEK